MMLCFLSNSICIYFIYLCYCIRSCYHLCCYCMCTLFACSKIQRYSPTDSAKTFEKPVSRKVGVKFHPKQVLDLVQLGMQLPEPITQTKRQLLEAYMDVSQIVPRIFIL